MKLLQRAGFRRRKQLSSLLDARDDWFEGEEYSEVLKKELNRCDRTSSPLSFVLLDLSNNGQDEISSGDRYQFLKELVILISDNTRDYDVKYFCNKEKIGVVLINTSLGDAKAFVGKLSRKIYERLEQLNQTEYFKAVNSIAVCTYPAGKAKDLQVFNATPIIDKYLTFKKKMNNSNLDIKIKEDYNINMDWGLVPFSGTPEIYKRTIAGDMICRHNSKTYRSFKCLLDVMGALTGIVVLSPLMLVIAIAVKITSRGPSLFKQKRVGHLGEEFTFLKFRTMRTNSDDSIHKEYMKKLIEGNNSEINHRNKKEPLYKMSNDDRITRLGRILRKTSLDELPQLFNVLAGSMSLIGPRPAIHYEVEKYKEWHWWRMMESKPGITGLWQVYGRSRTTYDEMVRLDLRYIKNQSFLLDLKILLMTLPAVLYTKGAL